MDNVSRKKRGFVIGYLFGLCGEPKPTMAQKDPVAYLYNGTQLPPLPEWDKEKYPYAVMVLEKLTSSFSYYHDATIFFTEYPWKYDPVNRAFMSQPYCKYSSYRCFFEGSTKYIWQEFSMNEELGSWGKYGTFHEGDCVNWCSENVINYNDGTVYLYASAPIPVYE